MRASIGTGVGEVIGHRDMPTQAPSGTGRRGRRALGAVAVVLVVLGAACGGSIGGGPTSTASFVVDGSKFRIDEGGTLSVSVQGVPALNYSGPLGCKGQFFHLAYSPTYELFFRYTAVDAVLAYANNVYHFGKPPIQEKGNLVWDAQAPGSGGGTHHLVAKIACPLPAISTPLDAGR